MSGPIEVLVVEDTRVMRDLLVHVLESDPDLQVIDAVADGAAALQCVERRPPHVVLMDIHMRGMDGFEVTRRIMESRPVPIVLCSAIDSPSEVATSFRAMEAGAVAVIEKPVAPQHPDFPRIAAELLAMVKLMAEVKVVRRWSRHATAPSRASTRARIEVVGIGASTGGPPAVQTILAGLPRDFEVPILLVQHIATGFLPGLSEWLAQTTGFRVQIGASGLRPQPGHVYIAPDDYHMGYGRDGAIRLTRQPPRNGLRPAIDHLFESLALHCGARAVGVLLTGMGRDGALQLKAMRESGATTLVQDSATSVVHGMPGAAIELGAAVEILPVQRISDALCRHVRENNGEPAS